MMVNKYTLDSGTYQENEKLKKIITIDPVGVCYEKYPGFRNKLTFARFVLRSVDQKQ